MQASKFFKAGMLTIFFVCAFMLSWELYWRSKHLPLSYNDDEALWSDKRAMVYEPSDKSMVFIGSSRIKFDLDIPTWEKQTGIHAIQLAMVGTNPVPVLENLANDENFKGRVVVDVTEGLFFGPPAQTAKTAFKNMTYYSKRTPTQRASFVINHFLESHFAFLDKDYKSLNALLSKIPVKDRKGIYPDNPGFPIEFDNSSFERQSFMSDRFVKDTVLQNKVKGIWYMCSQRRAGPPPPPMAITEVIDHVKKYTDKIIARGGSVLFVRTPSSGAYLQGELHAFPRDKYWDALVKATGCPSVHFMDYPAINHFICPEYSHLSPADAIVFTNDLIDIFRQNHWLKDMQRAQLSFIPKN